MQDLGKIVARSYFSERQDPKLVESDGAEIIDRSPLQQSSWLILHFGKKMVFLLLLCVCT